MTKKRIASVFLGLFLLSLPVTNSSAASLLSHKSQLRKALRIIGGVGFLTYSVDTLITIYKKGLNSDNATNFLFAVAGLITGVKILSKELQYIKKILLGIERNQFAQVLDSQEDKIFSYMCRNSQWQRVKQEAASCGAPEGPLQIVKFLSRPFCRACSAFWQKYFKKAKIFIDEGRAICYSVENKIIGWLLLIQLLLVVFFDWRFCLSKLLLFLVLVFKRRQFFVVFIYLK